MAKLYRHWRNAPYTPTEENCGWCGQSIPDGKYMEVRLYSYYHEGKRAISVYHQQCWDRAGDWIDQLRIT